MGDSVVRGTEDKLQLNLFDYFKILKHASPKTVLGQELDAK